MSLANVKTVLSGGLRTGWWFQIDADGYFAGTTGSLTPGATGQGAYLITGIKTANYKGIEPLVLLGTGEDQPQGQIVEPPQTLPSFDIVGSIGNLTLDGLTQNTLTFNVGTATYGVIQPYLPNYASGGLQIQRLAISKDAATNGSPNWDGVLFPKVWTVPLSSDGAAEKKVTDWKYHVICNPSSILPTGLPITSVAMQTTSGVEFPFTSPNKTLTFAWKGTGAVTAFNLPTSAIPSTGLLANGYPATIYVEGVVTAPVSITLVSTNYVVTFSPAPASNARIVGVFEYM